MTVTLEIIDEIAILNLGDGENRLNPTSMAAMLAHLDTAQAQAQALVTIGGGKFFSNGLDLDYLHSHPERHDEFIRAAHAVYSRFLTFPMATVAALNGHAFGAGAIIAVAHDYRIMRADRGYFCFPEVDINIPFPPSTSSLIQAKLTPHAAVASMTTGRRFGGPEAVSMGLVDEVASADALQSAAIAAVAPLRGKSQETLSIIKRTMYANVVDALAAG